MQRSSPQLRLCAQLGDRTVKLHYLITRTCINLHRYSACLHFTPYARTLKTLLQNPPDITRTSLSSNLLLFLNIDTIHSFENTHQSLKNALSLRKSCDSGFPLAARTLFQPRFKLPRIPRRARCVGKHSLARSFKYTFERGRLMINLTRKDQRFDHGARQTSRIKCKIQTIHLTPVGGVSTSHLAARFYSHFAPSTISGVITDHEPSKSTPIRSRWSKKWPGRFAWAQPQMHCARRHERERAQKRKEEG